MSLSPPRREIASRVAGLDAVSRGAAVSQGRKLFSGQNLPPVVRCLGTHLEDDMPREQSITAGIIAAATAVVGLIILAPTIARAWAGSVNVREQARGTAMAPQNARARRLSARVAKKVVKRAAHAHAA
jgi:hypothetical protein